MTKFNFITKILFIATLAVTVVQTSSAQAQEINLPQLLLGESYGTFARGEESQIVIRVRNFNDKGDACGSGFNLSRLGGARDEFDFPHAGGRSLSTDLPRSSGSYDFPRPGSSASSFQLPVGSRSPQIVGCLDYQRNILFITIRPPVQQSPTSPVEPRPTPRPNPQPDTPPTGQVMLPQSSTTQNPTSFIGLPHQPSPNQNLNGFSPSYPVIK